MYEMKPIHEHDCSTCIFMATVLCHGDSHYDWYIHVDQHMQPETIIGRYGPNGEYVSYPVFLLDDARCAVSAIMGGAKPTLYGEVSTMIIAREMLRRHRGL